MNGRGVGANPNYYASNLLDLDGDLPPSLPSYLPANSNHGIKDRGHPQDPYAAHGNGSAGGGGGGGKRQAPLGTWKTPPHFLYSAHDNTEQTATSTHIASPFDTQSGKEKDHVRGMRDLNFQDQQGFVSHGHPHGHPQSHPHGNPHGYPHGNPAASHSPGQMSAYGGNRSTAAGVIPSSTSSTSSAEPISSTGGISAEQFSAGTGGLKLDTELLARMSGKDVSEIGEDQIKSIMSCPDLLVIYQRMQDEDERRRRRLARNRASARLRRQKKKSMVESYESEVSDLEEVLKVLKEHKWGSGSSEQLRMFLGESKQNPNLNKEVKKERTSSTLHEHSMMMSRLQVGHTEQTLLSQLGKPEYGCGADDSDLLKELCEDLDSVLELSADQKQKLSVLSQEIENETRELAITRKCIEALRTHDWLHFPLIESSLEHYNSILQPTQVNKILSWTAFNAKPISRLQVNRESEQCNEEDQLVFEFPSNA